MSKLRGEIDQISATLEGEVKAEIAAAEEALSDATTRLEKSLEARANDIDAKSRTTIDKTKKVLRGLGVIGLAVGASILMLNDSEFALDVPEGQDRMSYLQQTQTEVQEAANELSLKLAEMALKEK